MDHYRFQQMLADDSSFDGSGKIYGLDIVQNADEPKSIFRQTRLRRERVSDWLNRKAEFKIPHDPGVVAELRVICMCDLQRRDELSVPVIPMAKELFVQTLDNLNLTKLFFLCLMQGIAMWHKYKNFQTDRYHQYLLQTKPRPDFYFSLALTYDSEEHVTTAMLVGASDGDAIEFFHRLEWMKAHISAPMLMATLVTEFKVDGLNKSIDQAHEELRDLRHQTGVLETRTVPSFNRQGSMIGDIRQTSEPSDPITMSKGLTRIRADLAQYWHYIEILEPLVKYLDEASKECLDGTSDEEHKARMENATALLNVMHSWNLKYIQSTIARSKYLSERATAYVQTVYSLIAQRDNAMNMQIAETSVKVAKASQLESKAMREIAEDSRKIADATAKDSAAMRTISFITMVLLPATSVATVCSTSFFNFQAAQGQPVVSERIWIYIVITVGLTALVYLGWMLLFQMDKIREFRRRLKRRAAGEVVIGERLPHGGVNGSVSGREMRSDSITEKGLDRTKFNGSAQMQELHDIQMQQTHTSTTLTV